MARTNGGNINFKINMTVDKNGLNQVLKPLQQIQSELNSMSTDKLSGEFQEAANSAKQLESIINSSWNDKLGQLNLDKFNQSIKTSYGSVEGLKNSLTGAGTSGEAAFNALASEVLNTNLQLKESNKLLDDMATSMANTVKWGITSSIFNTMTSSIRQAYYYTKDLDRSLNDIRIVTKDSADTMERFAKTANDAAKDLGRSTLDYTKAALSFYQQGLSDEQVAARTEVTLKAQNITGVGTEMVDYLTSVWNGFNIGAEEAEGVVDKLAKVADSSASDMSQLAIAMSKVASTANVMGVDINQLTAQLATVIATTRQAPESVGTAFKTIYTRLNDIAAGADEAQISLGNYSGQMADLGFNVLDANGRLRDTGQVIEQIGSRWEGLSKQQQISIARIMGGMRQVNQLMSLFENWTTYSELLNDALTAQGSLNQKNNIYLESTAAYMEKFGAEVERTYDILFNQDIVNGFAGIFTKVLNIFNDFIQGIGGGANVFAYFGSVLVGVFDNQIAASILKAKRNLDLFLSTKNIQKFKEDFANLVIEMNKVSKSSLSLSNKEASSVEDDALKARAKIQAELYAASLKARQGLNKQQEIELNNTQKQIGLLTEQKELLSNLEKIKQQYSYGDYSTAKEFELQEKNLKNITDELGQSLSLLRERSVLIEKQKNGIASEAEKNRLNEINNLLRQNSSYLNIHNDLRAKGYQGQNLIKKIIEEINNKYKNSQQELQVIIKLKQLQQKYEKGQIQNLDQEIQKLLRVQESYKNIGEQVVKTQSVIRGLSAVGQILTSLGGAISTYFNQSATAGEKLNAIVSGAQGIIGGILSTIPGIGFAVNAVVQGMISLTKSILQATGAWDSLENNFKSTSEKIKEFNQTMQKASQVNQQNTAQIASLQQIKDQYEKLSNKAGDYNSTINNLTEDEKNRYYELTDRFTQYNQAVIVGYDQQGHAIVKGQEALLETIEVLKQAKKEANIAALGDENNALKGIRLRHTKDTSTPEIQQAESDMNEANRQYNKILSDVRQKNQGKVTPDVQSFQLTEYNNALWDILFNNSDYEHGQKLLNKKIGDTEQTIQDFYYQYQKAVNSAFKTNFFGKIIDVDEEKIAQALSVGNTIKQAIEKYGTSEESSKLKDFGSLLSNFNGQIVQTYRKIKEETETTYNKLYDQATKAVNYTQQDVNEILMTFETFDEDGQIGDSYRKLKDFISTLDLNSSFIYQALSDYITSFTDEEVLPDQIDEKAKEYVSNLQNVLSNTYDTILNAIKENDFDEENFKGTAQQRIDKAIEIIKSILLQLNPEQFNTAEARQALAGIFNQMFDLQGVEIGQGLQLNTDKITDDAIAVVEDAQQAIYQTLTKKFGYKQDGTQKRSAKIKLTDLQAIFDEDELKDFENTINEIDWGAFLRYTDEGRSAASALKKVWLEAKRAAQDAANVEIPASFDTVFDTDSLVKHLQGKKKITDEEKNYLEFLQQEDSKLAEIATHEGWNSDNYIKQLKIAMQQGQYLYQQRLLNEKASLEKAIKNQQTIIAHTEEGSAARIEAEEKLAQYKFEQQDLDYNLLLVEEKLTENAQERAAAEQDAALAMIENAKAVAANGKSALNSLQSGSKLSDDQALALAYLEKQDEKLRQIAEDKENGGRYSLEYTVELEKQLKLQQDLNEQIRKQNIAILQGKRNRLQEEYTKESQGIVSDQEYYNQLGKQQQDAALLSLYESQTEERARLAEKQSQIMAIDAEIIQLQSQGLDVLDAQNGKIQSVVNSFNEMADTLVSGGQLSTEQMQAFEAVLDNLVKDHSQLTTAAGILKQTWLAGTQQYAEALALVSQALDQVMYEQLNDQLASAFEDLQSGLEDLRIGVDPTDFENWADSVETFLQADKSITIAVHTDAENEFERINNELQNIYDAAGKIGQNFTIAASDIRELNNVFPGILQGMQRLDDGSYQLNANMVQRAIATAQTETGADAKVFMEKTQRQAKLLHQKAAIYKAMAEAADVLAGNEVDSDMDASQARAVISKGLQDLKATNAELSAENQMDNEKAVADSSKSNSQIVAQNWAGSSQAAADSVYDFANSAVANYNAIAQAAQAALTGKPLESLPTLTLPTISNGYTGMGGTTQETLTLQGTQAALDNPNTTQRDWANLRDQYNRMYGITERMANDMDGMIAQTGARLGDIGTGLQNVYRGQGIDGPQEVKPEKTRSSNPRSSNPRSSSSSEREEKVQDPDYIEYLQDEKDRYHDIDLAIKSIDKSLDRLQKTQKKLYGKDLINNLNKQLSLLDKQVGAYQTKIELATQERDEIYNSLKAQGVLFDSNTGAITNYASALTNKLNQVNAIIAHYNTLSAQEQKNYKEVVEKAKQDYEKFKKQIQNYDKLISETLPELRDKIQEIRDKEIEIAISKFKMAIEIELDLSQAKRDWNDFKKKVIDQVRDDDILGNTKSALENFFSYYDENNLSRGLIPSLTDQVYGTIEQLNQINAGGTSDTYGDNKAQAIEDLQKYAKDLMNSLQGVEDIIKEVEQAFYDMADAAQEAFDEQKNEYGFLTDLIEHDKKLIQLLYGDQAFDKINSYNQKQIQNDKRELDFQRQQRDFWYARMQAEKNRMNEFDKESNEYKQSEKRFKELQQHWMDSVKDFNQQVQDSIQHLLDQYQNNVAIIFKDLGKQLTNGKGLDYVKEEWELINDNADQYLDRINSMYEIQKLQNEFEKTIDDNAGNLSAQKSLTNLMNEQLKMLKDKDKLTKYDVDRANLLLQIEIKRLALQQARNNKSKLRLRRDSQGNYSYQYVADQAQAAKAQQDLADARNSLYNLDKDQLIKNQSDMLATSQEFFEKLRKLYEEYPTWTEQAEAKRQLLIDQYETRINGITQRNQDIRLNLSKSAFDELAALYDTDVDNFLNMSRTQQDELMSSLVPQWNTSVQEMTNAIMGQGGLIPSCQSAFDELENNTYQYEQSLRELQDTGRFTFEEITEGIDETIQITNELIDDNEELIETYNQEWDALQQIIDQVRLLAQAYRTAREQAIGAAQAATSFMEAERTRAAEQARRDESAGSDYNDNDLLIVDNNNLGFTDNSSGGGDDNALFLDDSYYGGNGFNDYSYGSDNGRGASWSRVVEVYNLINSGQVQNDPQRRCNLSRMGYNDEEISQGQELINKVYPPSLGGAGMDWDAAKRAMGYDTGGYTGEWGRNGKIGILHEKELILNSADTKNILSAVQASRNIAQLLGSLNIGGFVSNALNGIANPLTAALNNDQKVYINANFPAVNSRVEIEEAFSNLINRASQYAFNTRK